MVVPKVAPRWYVCMYCTVRCVGNTGRVAAAEPGVVSGPRQSYRSGGLVDADLPGAREKGLKPWLSLGPEETNVGEVGRLVVRKAGSCCKVWYCEAGLK